ncbi:GAF domain-containing protein [Spongisporangium articulatum]|uniref:GAF domain-containing protein n=1 Tax=Spongisporangium articulatum TaxID=3362603 RepID=A0ABW8AQ31_9ACTN
MSDTIVPATTASTRPSNPLPLVMPLPQAPVDSLDAFARRVATELESPVALVSLVDAEGQFFPGAVGLPEPMATERWTPLSHSFCQHVVTSQAPLVVGNAHDDPLVRHNGAVQDLGVIAYAGAPVVLDGMVVGAVCAIDHRPRTWSAEQVARLGELARECSLALGQLAS